MVNHEFWQKWIEANEIEKQKLVKTLPIFTNIKCPLFSTTVINSYFEDIYLFLKAQYEKY